MTTTIPQRAYRAGSDIDCCYTPPEAVALIVPFLKSAGIKRIWEPAAGSGLLADALVDHGFDVYQTGINTGQDFLTYTPRFQFDAIVTNFPFAIDYQCTARCMTFGKPWAAIMKTDRSGVKRFRKAAGWRPIGGNGITAPPPQLQKLVPSSRVCYKMPKMGWFTYTDRGVLTNNSAQFSTCWWCYDLNLPAPEILVHYRQVNRLALKMELEALGFTGGELEHLVDMGVNHTKSQLEADKLKG